MIEITEFTITKFLQGETPSEGEILYSRIFTRESFNASKKALKRLTDIVMHQEKELVKYVNIGFTISKVAKDAEFNDNGSIILKESTSNKHRTKAAFRLAKHLSKNDKAFNYFARHIQNKEGKYHIITAQRNTVLLNDDDKLKSLKRKTSARKAVLTRTINKAKKIRDSYKATLFQDGYKEDDRFLKAIVTVKTKRERYKDMKISTTQEIESVTGGFNKGSINSLKKIIKKAS